MTALPTAPAAVGCVAPVEDRGGVPGLTEVLPYCQHCHAPACPAPSMATPSPQAPPHPGHRPLRHTPRQPGPRPPRGTAVSAGTAPSRAVPSLGLACAAPQPPAVRGPAPRAPAPPRAPPLAGPSPSRFASAAGYRGETEALPWREEADTQVPWAPGKNQPWLGRGSPRRVAPLSIVGP